jgi:hypothetical protein
MPFRKQIGINELRPTSAADSVLWDLFQPRHGLLDSLDHDTSHGHDTPITSLPRNPELTEPFTMILGSSDIR